MLGKMFPSPWVWGSCDTCFSKLHQETKFSFVLLHDPHSLPMSAIKMGEQFESFQLICFLLSVLVVASLSAYFLMFMLSRYHHPITSPLL